MMRAICTDKTARATKSSSGEPVQSGTSRHTSTERDAETRASYSIESERIESMLWLFFLTTLGAGGALGVAVYRAVWSR